MNRWNDKLLILETVKFMLEIVKIYALYQTTAKLSLKHVNQITGVTGKELVFVQIKTQFLDRVVVF